MIKLLCVSIFFPLVLFGQNESPFKDSLRLRNWDRKYYSATQNRPTLLYVVIGNFIQGSPVDSDKYGTIGLPKGIEITVYTKKDYPEIYKAMTEFNGWNVYLNENKLFKDEINKSTDFIVISGSIADTGSLNYLRNTIGMISYLTDNGGVGVFDPLTSTFRSSLLWKESIFDYNASAPRCHVKLHCNTDSVGNKSYYTKGMEKFGRPNISVHGVTTQTNTGITDLINRTIEYLAFGGIIKNKQIIRMNSLPNGMYFEVKKANTSSIFEDYYLEIIWN